MQYSTLKMIMPIEWNMRAVGVAVVAFLFVIYLFSYLTNDADVAVSRSTGEKSPVVKVPASSQADLSWVKDHPMQGLSLPNDLNPLKAVIRDASFKCDAHNVPARIADPVGTPSGKTLLLLHGAAYNAHTWEKSSLQTTQTMAALGHRVVAVDLPKSAISNPDALLQNLIHQVIKSGVDSSLPVVVSPSMSGRYSIPLLLKQSEEASMCGLVTVAPAIPPGLGEAQLASVKSTPVMIVRGENDKSHGVQSSRYLTKIPSATPEIILPGASHPAYLDQPRMWHEHLHAFMNRITCPKI